MSKTILANVDGFTPVIDTMIPEVGLLTATIFGKVWRYCQMSDGVCKAGQERIADELGLSRPTINTHLSKLCDTGYLRDLTPTLSGMPHLYADTGKAGLSISFTAHNGEGVKEIDTTCKTNLQVGVKEIYTKKEVKKESNIPETPKSKVKKGDMIDCYLDTLKSPGGKKSMLKLDIESQIASRFRNNPTSKRWQEFIDYAARMQQENGWEIKVFLDWLMAQRGFDLNFWPPDKMKENYPRAFAAQLVETSEPAGILW